MPKLKILSMDSGFKIYFITFSFLHIFFSSEDGDGTPVDPLKLEQSLCHVLMDKAILNCLLLLDKADMESRIRILSQQQTQFDFSGIAMSKKNITLFISWSLR